MTGNHIVLEGIDGAGKTAIAGRLAERLQDLKLRFCSNKQVATTPEYASSIMQKLATLLWPKESTTFDHLLPVEYWAHVQAAWYSLHSEFVIKPLLVAGSNLISDGWYYKFAAKLRARALLESYIATIFSHVQSPDLVVLLKANVEEIWDRKQNFRHHEMGMHHKYPRLGKESFIDYQSKVFRCLSTYAESSKWRVIDLDPSAAINDNVEKVASCIEEFLHSTQSA